MNLLLSALVLISALFAVPSGLGSLAQQDPPQQDAPATETPQNVVLKVKVGEETREFGPLPVSGKITVEKLMRDLANQDDKFQFEAQGKGETFFVTSLLGQVNEGRGGRNWVFKINDRLANRGAGTMEVEAGAVVTWEFRGRESRSP